MVSIATTVAFVGQACADRTTIWLSTTDVSTHKPQDSTLGDYYIVKFQLPASLRSADLKAAFLEFHANVSAKSFDGWVNETPVVEAYALTARHTAQLDPTKFRKPSPAVRNVRTGENRRIRLNVTEIVLYLLDNPAGNHGLAVGSFRGQREGMFEIKTNVLPNNAVARLVIDS